MPSEQPLGVNGSESEPQQRQEADLAQQIPCGRNLLTFCELFPLFVPCVSHGYGVKEAASIGWCGPPFILLQGFTPPPCWRNPSARRAHACFHDLHASLETNYVLGRSLENAHFEKDNAPMLMAVVCPWPILLKLLQCLCTQSGAVTEYSWVLWCYCHS